MLRLLILGALAAMTLSHDKNDSGSLSLEENESHCPGHTSKFYTLGTISPCVNGTNGTISSCAKVADCASSQKCCQTTCGYQCVNPIPEVACTTASNCAGDTPLCCRNVCATTCIAPTRPLPPAVGKNGRKHGRGK
ncbi:antileukoproteinase-like [Ambystoma mexicanum]|uniref:antileukoproteinase-like n=1 Tax=Ambystoma mexicanum TaxID=8296 RepID=UPI0037E7325A